MSNLHERAKQILISYPTAEAVHFTSDGSPFVTENSAKLHARTLEDKTITPVSRAEANEEDSSAGVGSEGTEKTDAVKPLSKMNKTELLAEAAKRNVTVDESLTKAGLIAAIEAAETATTTPAVTETTTDPAADAAPAVTE